MVFFHRNAVFRPPTLTNGGIHEVMILSVDKTQVTAATARKHPGSRPDELSYRIGCAHCWEYQLRHAERPESILQVAAVNGKIL